LRRLLTETPHLNYYTIRCNSRWTIWRKISRRAKCHCSAFPLLLLTMQKWQQLITSRAVDGETSRSDDD